MVHRFHTYHFGQVYLLGNKRAQNQYYKQAISSTIKRTLGEFRYGFFGAQELSYRGLDFLFGNLVRYKEYADKGEIVDEDNHVLRRGMLHDAVVAKSEFFLEPKTGIIAYRPIKSRMNEAQFCEFFPDLIAAALHGLGIGAEMQPISFKFDKYEAIKSFQRIRRVSFVVHPTNPSNKALYRKLDERIKELGAKTLQQTIIAKDEKGLDKEKLLEDDTLRGMAMAEDGYGSATISGQVQENGKLRTRTINSEGATIISDDNPLNVLHQLFYAFRGILNTTS